MSFSEWFLSPDLNLLLQAFGGNPDSGQRRRVPSLLLLLLSLSHPSLPWLLARLALCEPTKFQPIFNIPSSSVMNPINEQFIVIKSSVVAGDPRTNYYYKEAYLPNSEVKLFKVRLLCLLIPHPPLKKRKERKGKTANYSCFLFLLFYRR